MIPLPMETKHVSDRHPTDACVTPAQRGEVWPLIHQEIGLRKKFDSEQFRRGGQPPIPRPSLDTSTRPRRQRSATTTERSSP